VLSVFFLEAKIMFFAYFKIAGSAFSYFEMVGTFNPRIFLRKNNVVQMFEILSLALTFKILNSTFPPNFLGHLSFCCLEMLILGRHF
jgi:hypothetical protein